MRTIIPAITTLLQYLNDIESHPERYSPETCEHCGHHRLWNHGYYERKSDRGTNSRETLNPIPIPRFYCPNCKHTCSVLPECIPPRRWYLWEIQQVVLLLLLSGQSLTEISQSHQPSHRTIKRWWYALQSRFDKFSFYLKSRYSELGYITEVIKFWQYCLETLGLSKVMVFLNNQGLVVP